MTGTVLIIAAGAHSWFNRVFLSNRVLVWFGLISYPLYLWHWPLLSFARIIEGEIPSRFIHILAVFIAIVLAWLTYKLIEHPLRFGKCNKSKVGFLVIMVTLIGCIGYYTWQRDGLTFRNPVKDQESKVALSFLEWADEDNADTICRKRFGNRLYYCKLAKDSAPTVALLGDSIANSCFDGLSGEYDKVGDNLVMLGTPGCPPLLDVTALSPTHRSAEFCESLNSNALKEIAKMKSIHTVILAAKWHLYINGNQIFARNPLELRATDESTKSNAETFKKQIKKTLDLLASSGKKIIVMKQMPELPIKPGNCVVKNRPLRITKKEQKCTVPLELLRSHLSEYEKIFDLAIIQNNRIKVVDPLPALCSGTGCPIMDGAYPLYRDCVHLSLHGSRYMARRLNITKVFSEKDLKP